MLPRGHAHAEQAQALLAAMIEPPRMATVQAFAARVTIANWASQNASGESYLTSPPHQSATISAKPAARMTLTRLSAYPFCLNRLGSGGQTIQYEL